MGDVSERSILRLIPLDEGEAPREKAKNHRVLRPREQARMEGATRAGGLVFPYHPFDEGEAPTALLTEGATRAPTVDRSL